MDYKRIITRDAEIMLGKPIIKGTRITVELIMRKLTNGYSFEQLLNSYPPLTKDQIYAVFEYAADIIANDEITKSKIRYRKM
jgi:uncharacterized protein (DUF433 family)